ncbi:MAG: phage scaffolding protein, partial [Lachnospiraceae bacterium]|nr:phage scaffolding protein [Lachnospiraceae bacterium]
TEFLKGLGLEQDAIDKIMAENGKDIAAEQAKTDKAKSERDNYKTQLDTAKESLAKFDGVNVEDLKGQITKLQGDLKAKDEEYAAKEAERTFNETLSGAITAAGGKNAKAITAKLDLDSLKASKNQGEDIKNAIEAIRKSDAYMFGSEEPHKNAVGATGGADGKEPSGDEFAAMRALMGLPAKKK